MSGFAYDGDSGKIKGGTDETVIGNVADALKANVTNFPATQNVAVVSTVEVEVKNDSGSPLPISAASLPLPAGASTSALQTTGNTSTASIDTKTPTLGQKTMAGSRPVVIASDQTPLAAPPITDQQKLLYFIQPLLNGASPVMVVSGTVGSPVVFSYTVPSGQVVLLESIRMFIQDNGVADPFKFGAIGSGDLTNGVLIECVISSVTYQMAIIKNNMDLGMTFSQSPQLPPTASGWYNNSDSYAAQWDMRRSIRLAAGDILRVKIQDNLTSLDNFRMSAEFARGI